jgi:hypothetical protein
MYIYIYHSGFSMEEMWLGGRFQKEGIFLISPNPKNPRYMLNAL